MARRWMIAEICAVLLIAGLAQGCKKTVSTGPEPSGKMQAEAKPASQDKMVTTKLALRAEVRPAGSKTDMGWSGADNGAKYYGDHTVFTVSERQDLRLTPEDQEWNHKLAKDFGDTELEQLVVDFADTPLASLKLSGTRVTDAGLAHLAKLTNLKTLHLDACTGVTDAGLVHLEGLTNLTELYLNDTGVTDVGLGHVAKLTNLTGLGLDHTSVTDKGLVHLEGLTNLALLSLSGCKDVTDEGEHSLHRKLPRSSILRLN